MSHPSSSVSRDGLRFNREFAALVIRRSDPRFPKHTIGLYPEFVEGDPFAGGNPSMRIMTLDGADTSQLQVGEEWLVQVIGQPQHLFGRQTRDGRAMIRFNVRPVSRVERQEMVFERRHGKQSSFRLETHSGVLLLKNEPIATVCETNRKYLLGDGRIIVDVDVYSAINPVSGETVYEFDGRRVLTRQVFYTETRERLGRMLPKDFGHYVGKLPSAPQSLVELIPAERNAQSFYF